MKFPALTELDKDQEAIYEGAPRTGTILIVGPPGTGKTVIAFHRAHYLQGRGHQVKVLMFNKVLKHYTGRRDVADGVDVSTVHSWANTWWRGFNGPAPGIPRVAGDRWEYDWGKIRERALLLLAQGKKPSAMAWGHLLIDEGQDFRPEMYGTLNFIMALVNGSNGTKPRKSDAITVLADDNQRLVEGRNSTVEQIRQALLLHESDKNVFRLKKNYRNTKEIARFAARFYVGNRSGIPLLPEKKGALPTVYTVGRDTEGKNLNAIADKIATYAKLRNEEIGVLVPDNKIRTSMRNRLRAKLGDRVKVQSYAADDKSDPIEDLVFDEAGCITVLNYNSAKGLEFDAVFVVDPGRLVTASLPPLHLKMTLYVMCSRARTTLGLMLVKDNSLESLLEWIGPAEGLCKLEEL